MKKKVFIIALVCAVTASAAVIFLQNKTQISELTEANVEALANGVDKGGASTGVVCYGPKRIFGANSVCRCRNTTTCLDNSGCSNKN